MNVKRIVGIILIVLVGTGIALGRRAVVRRQKSVETTPVVRKTVTEVISASGKTKAKRRVELKFQTAGRLAWVGVSEGDSVQAYQAIASLDTRDVEQNLIKALRDYSRQRNDFDESTRVTHKDTTTDNAPNDTIKRILEKNQWDLDKTVADVELKHLALEYARLSTPIAGIIASLGAPLSGVNITAATVVADVVDPESIVFAGNIDEIDLAKLAVGQSARIRLDAFGDREFSGSVQYLSYVSETSSGGSTVFPVEIAMVTEGSQLRVGLNGDIDIIVAVYPDVFVVPVDAVREIDGQKSVYKKVDSRYENVAVSTGYTGDSEVVILSGLGDGDIVVTKGFSSL